MKQAHSVPGEIVELQRGDRVLSIHDMKTLIRTEDFRVVQIRLPAGAEIPTYEAHGQIIIQCLEGHVSILAKGTGHELASDQLLYLLIAEPFSIVAKADSSIIATVVSPTTGREVTVIGS